MDEHRIPPLRRVTKRRRNREEVLECGHEHPGSYREARRRRCHECFITQVGVFKTKAEAIEAVQAELAAEAQAPTVLTESQAAEALLEAPEGPRCAYCLDTVGPLSSCSGCGTLTHTDCRRELKRCPTIGCAARGKGTPMELTQRRIVVQVATRPVQLPAKVGLLRRLGRVVLAVVLAIFRAIVPLLRAALGRSSND